MSDESTESKVQISIMPDFGGAWAWIAPAGSLYLGSLYATGRDWGDVWPIYESLELKFWDWQGEFEGADHLHSYALADLDWPRFHARGLELCWFLSEELAGAVRIFYVKAMEDPNCYRQYRVEVLRDGTVVEAPDNRARSHLQSGWLPLTVIASGQTGVEAAALDWACDHRILHRGWCPRGGWVSRSSCSPFYQLQEAATADDQVVLLCNCAEADAVLILHSGPLAGTVEQVRTLATDAGKPCRLCDLGQEDPERMARELLAWMQGLGAAGLCITGPSEEQCPGVYDTTLALLERCTKLNRKLGD